MKNVFTSKVLWFNLLAIVALGVQTYSQKYLVLDPTQQATLITLVNFALRFVTTKPVTLGASQ